MLWEHKQFTKDVIVIHIQSRVVWTLLMMEGFDRPHPFHMIGWRFSGDIRWPITFGETCLYGQFHRSYTEDVRFPHDESAHHTRPWTRLTLLKICQRDICSICLIIMLWHQQNIHFSPEPQERAKNAVIVNTNNFYGRTEMPRGLWYDMNGPLGANWNHCRLWRPGQNLKYSSLFFSFCFNLFLFWS